MRALKFSVQLAARRALYIHHVSGASQPPTGLLKAVKIRYIEGERIIRINFGFMYRFSNS